MDREIKFRAWDRPSQSMIEDVTDIAKARYYEQPLMQSVGMRDRNGKEIFEGDIVKLRRAVRSLESVHMDHFYQEELIAEVIFRNGCFVLGHSGWYFWDYAMGGSDSHVEVLGNRYENPEILKAI